MFEEVRQNSDELGGGGLYSLVPVYAPKHSASYFKYEVRRRSRHCISNTLRHYSVVGVCLVGQINFSWCVL